MTFYVNGIKQENETEQKVEMLVCVDASLFVRKLLEEHTILILSLKEFADDKKDFGDVYFTITKNFQDIDIVTKYTDPQEAADFFSFVGFDIQRIDRRSLPIPPAQSAEIIANAKQQAAIQKKEVEGKERAEEAAEKKIYEDPKLESAKKIISQVFEKVDISLKRSTGMITIQDMKTIKSLVEELKKLRMGTNFEKIRETIQAIMKFLERVDNEYFVSIQNPAAKISEESLVTTSDVDKEIETMENVKILKSIGAHISLKNQDYASFGPGAIYRKFLQKDLLLKLGNLPALLYSFYDIVELVLLVVLSLLGVYTLVNQIYLFAINPFGLAYMLMTMGLR